LKASHHGVSNSRQIRCRLQIIPLGISSGARRISAGMVYALS
jgi:hypothetical protein